MSKIVKQLQRERDKLNIKISTLEVERDKLDEAIIRLCGGEIVSASEEHERVTRLAESQISNFLKKEKSNE